MTARKTIGVLTFHRCINYGSYWQARCLVEGLRARGHEAVLLDHQSRRITWREWRCAFQPLLPDRVAPVDLPLYAAKTRRFLRAFDALPLSAPFDLDDPAGTPRFDAIVVGSDEVWNLTHPWYGGHPLFWGHGLNAERRVAYAASFGNYDAGAGLDAWRRELLTGFDAIAVRDENGRRLVAAALGCEPAVALDPVLAFPPAVPEDGDTLPDAPYALVYGHHFPAAFASAARAWAKARGLRLVSVGYRGDWADEQRISAGPLDFARLVAGAEAVLTNFFHGCVFALVNGKPFACALTPYRSNKVRDLTALLGAGRHLLGNDNDPAAVLDQPLDPAIDARIAALRATSLAFLDRTLA